MFERARNRSRFSRWLGSVTERSTKQLVAPAESEADIASSHPPVGGVKAIGTRLDGEIQVACTYPLYPLLGKPQTTLFRFSPKASHFGVKLVSTIALGSEQLFSSDKLIEVRQWQGHWFVVYDEFVYDAETMEERRGLPEPYPHCTRA